MAVPATATLSVLLVDDLPEQRDIYRAVLEHRGFQVTEAGDGEEAFRLAESQRPDLILMDVGLPWLDGWEVTRRLKSTPRTASIPVVALSAHVGSDGERLAEEAGCARFLAKTGDLQRVADVVSEIIGEPGA